MNFLSITTFQSFRRVCLQFCTVMARFALRVLSLYRCVIPRNAVGHGRGEEQTQYTGKY